MYVLLYRPAEKHLSWTFQARIQNSVSISVELAFWNCTEAVMPQRRKRKNQTNATLGKICNMTERTLLLDVLVYRWVVLALYSTLEFSLAHPLSPQLWLWENMEKFMLWKKAKPMLRLPGTWPFIQQMKRKSKISGSFGLKQGWRTGLNCCRGRRSHHCQILLRLWYCHEGAIIVFW